MTESHVVILIWLLEYLIRNHMIFTSYLKLLPKEYGQENNRYFMGIVSNYVDLLSLISTVF